MPFTIVTDSSSNLPQGQLARYGIRSVPLTYLIDDQPRDCPPADRFDAGAYYQQLRQGAVCSTSLSSTGRFVETFEPLLQSGQDVLCLTLSAGVSGTHQAACLAALELRGRYPGRDLFVFDTKAAALGEGLLVLYAAQLREQGFGLNAVLSRLERKVQQLHQLFTVEDLQYLRRGGRIGGVAATVGSMLHLKPLLRGEDGRIVLSGKVRGRKGALKALAEDYLAHAQLGGPVAITHADAAEDAALLAQSLQAADPRCRILTLPFEPVTGAHAGPGALALFYFGAAH